jgi:hypothetical protein
VQRDKKLCLHMARVRDLINARKAVVALLHAAQAAAGASTRGARLANHGPC